MTPDIASAAPTVVTAFADSGGILGLIVLSLLVFIALATWLVWGFMNTLIKNHEARMDAQELRHQRDRDAANQHWQAVTQAITADMKSAMAELNRSQSAGITTMDRVDRNVEILRRRRAA